jgi:glycosyltransferase involved in cell wall biosynthesis
VAQEGKVTGGGEVIYVDTGGGPGTMVEILQPDPGKHMQVRQRHAHLPIEAPAGAGVAVKLVSSLEDDLRDAAMLVYISGSEGLGSGALLAMSAAVPVIASRVGGLPEVITHGENGLLVDNDPAAFAAAIRELLASPDRRRQIGAAARHTIVERFTSTDGSPYHGSLPPGVLT